MKHSILLTAACALALFSAGACRGLVEQAYPERHQHMISAERTGEPVTGPPSGVLCLRQPSISQAYEGLDLVYRTGPSAFRSDFYNGFFTPPAAMIHGLSLGWLRAAGIFEHVTVTTNPLIPTYYLETHVSAIYGDYVDIERPAAVVDLQFFLLDNRDLPAGVVFELPMTRSVPLKSTDPNDLFEGWQIAFSEIFWELETALARLE